MSNSDIKNLVYRQLRSIYPLTDEDIVQVEGAHENALECCERSFSRVKNKYYRKDGQTAFDPLQGCQWTFFLYTLSREIYVHGGGSICDKLYALCRMLSGADLFYQVRLPDVFTFDHPLGSIMGRAVYSNYFSFGQGCTVGNNHGTYPAFGESVFMLSDSKVIGACEIGSNVIIGANSLVKDEVIPSGSLVFGQSPNLIVKENHLEYVREYADKVFIYD